ncbi:MAG: ArsR/SmtB family transcription factor [Longimicrobiales bacterium]
MQAELTVIDQWSTAAALLDPVRQRVLAQLVEPDSASGVARVLRVPRQRVSYHVRELERHGLVEGVEERRRGNCVERVVRATARRFVISPAALGALGLTEGDAADRVSSNYAIAVAAQTIRDLSALSAGARTAEKRLPTLTLQLDVRFVTPEARAMFAEELAAFLAQSARAHHSPDSAQGRTYRFNVTGYPAPGGAIAARAGGNP